MKNVVAVMVFLAMLLPSCIIETRKPQELDFLIDEPGSCTETSRSEECTSASDCTPICCQLEVDGGANIEFTLSWCESGDCVYSEDHCLVYYDVNEEALDAGLGEQ